MTASIQEIMTRHPSKRIHISTVVENEDVRAATLDLVELIRRHDSQAKFFQVLHLNGREIVSKFWSHVWDRIELKTMQAIWHSGAQAHPQCDAWAFVGVGQYFAPIDTAEVLAACGAPAAILAPYEIPRTFSKRTLHDLGPINECVALASNKYFYKLK